MMTIRQKHLAGYLIALQNEYDMNEMPNEDILELFLESIREDVNELYENGFGNEDSEGLGN